MDNQKTEFIGHEFRKSPIEYKYGINPKPSILVNPMSNSILGQINQVLGNLVRNLNEPKTYVDKNDLRTGILAAAEFAIRSTTSKKKVIVRAN